MVNLKRVIFFAFFLCPTLVYCLGVGTAVAAGNPAPPVRSLIEMRHRNVVLQKWELSCAAAALATIMRYQYGIPATEHSVALGLIDRPEYKANPDLVRWRQGFSFLDLKRYVDSLNYEGIGLGELALTDLIQRAPLIVPIKSRGFPHFVVFRGGTQNTVLLADPAFGNVTMSTAKFLASWIKYQDFGHVGFVVTKAGKLSPPGRLSARSMDFLVFR